MFKKIRKFLGGNQLLVKTYYRIIDAYEGLFGLRDEFTPPRSMIFIGNGDFRKIGDEFFQYFLDLGGLKKSSTILDVGSGMGRMTLPFMNFLSKDAVYEGFDIVPEGVNWCTEKITAKYPNFHFQLADIYNERYNPEGTFKGEDYRFPYDDNRFDLIFLTSVFTHMLPAEMGNYLSEIARVLRPGGRCLITYFLLNDESMGHIAKNEGIFSFPFQFNEICKIEDEKIPEVAVAYNESYISDLYKKNGLSIVDGIHFGSWCGRKDFFSYQDIIVATKA